jgi:hypothetical protein
MLVPYVKGTAGMLLLKFCGVGAILAARSSRNTFDALFQCSLCAVVDALLCVLRAVA